MKKKCAFTLAESLLTLVILGIIIGLMTNAISAINPNRDKVLFLKAFHSLEIAVADVIRDGTRYDQNFYAEKNANFAQDPLPNAKVSINGEDYSGALSKNTAFCYFVAEQFNLIGGFDCSSSSAQNFKTSQGVCYGNMAPFGSSYLDIVINTKCSGDNDDGYVVRVFKDGRMTVPNGTGNQAKAYEWMGSQLKMK